MVFHWPIRNQRCRSLKQLPYHPKNIEKKYLHRSENTISLNYLLTSVLRSPLDRGLDGVSPCSHYQAWEGEKYIKLFKKKMNQVSIIKYPNINFQIHNYQILPSLGRWEKKQYSASYQYLININCKIIFFSINEILHIFFFLLFLCPTCPPNCPQLQLTKWCRSRT